MSRTYHFEGGSLNERTDWQAHKPRRDRIRDAHRITKRLFYERGAWANGRLFRIARADGAWGYWEANQ